jgi:hypothetical protein
VMAPAQSAPTWGRRRGRRQAGRGWRPQ